jgi:hypothetical protein
MTLERNSAIKLCTKTLKSQTSFFNGFQNNFIVQAEDKSYKSQLGGSSNAIVVNPQNGKQVFLTNFVWNFPSTKHLISSHPFYLPV